MGNRESEFVAMSIYIGIEFSQLQVSVFLLLVSKSHETGVGKIHTKNKQDKSLGFGNLF